MSRLVRAFGLLLFLSAALGAGQKAIPTIPIRPIAPLNLARVLDLYADGRFDEAVTSVAQAGDEIGRHLRRHWPLTGRRWIDADSAHRPERLLAAAALALETEHIRAERGDWRASDGDDPPCAAACVLDWAQQQLVERGTPDRAERAWYLAAAALAGGVRDWRYLRRPVDPARQPRATPGLMDRALVRFPGDASLGLEQALAAAGRFTVTVDGGRLAPNIVLPLTLMTGRGAQALADLRFDSQDAVAGMLAALRDEPLVGPEARLRLGYLHWTLQRDEAARDELTKAAAETSDADIRYLSQFLLGWMAIARGESAIAIPYLEAALKTRPGSQSAAVALASLELQRGDADNAHEIARRSLDERRADADPWRLFLYGHYPQWPARIADLRREVKP
jgi:tetratricopeptide (TPR) repeat protein